MSGGGGGGGKRSIPEEHEEHENHERWLVSYADMMTLLMVLFIVMFAISQVDDRKFAALKTGLTTGFGAPVAILSGGDQLLDVGGAVAPDTVNLPGASGGQDRSTESEQNTTNVNPQAVADLVEKTEQAQAQEEAEKLEDAQEKLKKALATAGLAKGASFKYDERGLVVTIATDKVLFDSGSATLLPAGRRILDALAPTLRALPNRLSIDGHTNSIPISTAQFPSNWELSSDRATGVLRHLHTSDGLPWTQMSATGYADTRPLLPDSNPRATAVNRRVEIVILAAVDNSQARAVAKLGSAADARQAEAAAAKAKLAEAARATEASETPETSETSETSEPAGDETHTEAEAGH